MTAVKTGLTNLGAVSSVAAPWRNTLHVMPDSYRCVVFSDGTNLVVTTSQNGTGAWSTPTVLVAGQVGVTPLVASCVVGSALFVVAVSQATSGGVTTYTTTGYLLPYTGAGVWGAIASQVIATTTIAPPLSVRAVYDPDQAVVAGSHPGTATGVIHVLIDSGTTWLLAALDPHNTTTPFGVLTTQTQTTGLSGPTGATNLLLEAPGQLYLVSPGNTQWAARAITFSSALSTGGGGTQSFDLGTMASALITGQNNYWNGHGLTVWPPVNFATPGTPSGIGLTFSSNTGGSIPTSGEVIPAGTWTMTALGTLSPPGATFGPMQVYIKHSNGTYTFLFSLPNGNNSVISGAMTEHALATEAAVTLGVGDQLYVELECHNFNGSTVSVSSMQLVVPAPSTTAISSYAFGPGETPTLVLDAHGAAICRSDATSTSGVDLFAYNPTSGNVQTIRRNTAGTYSAPLDVGTLGSILLTSAGLAASANGTTGEEHVMALGTVSSVTHLYVLKKVSNLWGAWTRLDTSSTSPVGSFGAASPRNLGAIGDAVIYLDNASSPYTLEWEDGGFAAASLQPTTPGLILVDSPGVDDIFGAIDNFNSLTTLPTFQGTYQDTVTNDRLGSYRLQVGAYDSGHVGVTGGALPGTNFLIPYPTGAPALTKYSTYTGTLTTWDSVGGLQSVADGVVHFMVVDPPQATLIGGSSLTTNTGTLVFDYWQPFSLPLAQYDLTIGINTSLVSLLAQVPGTLMRCSTMQAPSVIGDMSISTNDPLTPGQTIGLGNTSAAEGATVTTVTGTGPYTIGLTAPLTQIHSSGDRVSARVTTPTLTFFPSLSNLQTYTLTITPTVTPIAGSGWSAPILFSVQMNLVTAAPVTTLTSDWVPGTTPLDGGYELLNWVQPAPSGGSLTAVSWNIYQKLPTDSVFVLVGTIPAVVGPGSCRVWSVPSDTAVQFGLTTLDSQGVESAMTISPQTEVTFRVGLWLNEAANPMNCLEVGFRSTTQQQMVLEHMSNQDAANLFNRTAPVYTIDSLYALHTQTNGDYTLESEFEAQCFVLLEQWEREKTPVLIRDWRGRMFIGAVVKVQETIPDIPLYRGISLELAETDPYGYRYLLS